VAPGREGVLVRKRLKDSLKISIQPGMLSGTPCLDGTRVPAETIAEVVAYHGVEEAVPQFEITVADCAVCCWYVSAYRDRTKVGKHFKTWSETNFKAMWSGDWDEVEEPPRMERA
jgi:uncharacterized protein (DUF433 family)